MNQNRTITREVGRNPACRKTHGTARKPEPRHRYGLTNIEYAYADVMFEVILYQIGLIDGIKL